jgi:predicted dehydrogenase
MRILMVGLGGIGQRHLRNLRTLLGRDLEVLAYRVRRLARVVTPTLQVDAARDVEKEYQVRVFTDLEEALARKPSVAFICNPSSLHVPVARQCLAAGCDLFLEKPLSHNLDGVRELITAAQQGRRVAMVGYQLRYHPCYETLRDVLSRGMIGAPVLVRAVVGEYLPGWHSYEDYRQMYAARADLGGGVILSQIHEFDYLYSLFGLPQSVFALGGHLSSLEIDVEDATSVLMRCQVSGRVLPVHLQLDYLQRPPNRQCEIVGDAGKVLVDFHKLSVSLFNAAGENVETRTISGLERNQLFLDELSHFLACVKDRRQPLIDLYHGAQSLRIALAAKESVAAGTVVNLSSIGADLPAPVNA